jgi:putative molybdopterin biosynthesis protein
MSKEMMTTKEVAEYLRIHEKQVYALIKAKRIPATRVTGKWVFPKHLIDDWIASNSRATLAETREKSRRIEGAFLCAGSNDISLGLLFTLLREKYPQFYFFSASTGSTEGLKTLNEGYIDVSWSHLLDPKTGEYNVPFLPVHTPDMKPVVVNLFHRRIGLITAPDNPLKIKGFGDLARKDVTFVNRQKGSGSRLLIDHHLKELGVLPKKIKGYEREVWAHLDVGFSIVSGRADVGLAAEAISRMLRLPFIPVQEERFDMIVDQSKFFSKPAQALIDTLRSREFQESIGLLGYGFEDSGKIIYSHDQ